MPVLTTDFGRSLIIGRLAACHTLADLRKTWSSISLHYQRDPKVSRFKDQIKAQLEATE